MDGWMDGWMEREREREREVIEVLFYFECELLSALKVMLFLSLSVKSRKRLARDVIRKFATHAGLVCYVTNTDC